jgi:hypothetical protein
MGDRSGAGCVIGSTKVIVDGIGPEDISKIAVNVNLELDYNYPSPTLPPRLTPTFRDPSEVKPIKSLRRNYDVYPVIRYHFRNFYAGDFGYPLLNIRVKILPDPEPLVVPPCDPDNCPSVTCTPVHPFMIWNGPPGVPPTPTSLDATIVPAYCLKQGDTIFLDRSPMLTATKPTGKIESISLVPPQPVYGLWVTELANVANAVKRATSLIADINLSLEKHWDENVQRHEELGFAPSLVEADDFAFITFMTSFLSENPDISTGSRATPEFMIITDSIATGTLNVQYGYYEKAREGFLLDDLRI